MANDIDKTSPHYKGDFGSIYEVNRKFPTGGVAGDFVVIEGWAHYWNADRGTWCVNAERDSYWDELITNIIEKFKLVRGATYMGVASLGTVPEKVIGAKQYYFATEAGTYKNFGNLVVPQGVNVLYSENGSSWVNSSLLEVAQELGVSTQKVVSQKVLNDAFLKKFDKENIVQESGDSEDKVMSQKAVSDKLSDLSILQSLLSLGNNISLGTNAHYYFNNILCNSERNADGIWCYANTSGKCGFKLVEVKGNTIEEIKDFGIFDIVNGYNVIKIDNLLVRQNQQICTYAPEVGSKMAGIAYTNSNIPSNLCAYDYNTETGELSQFNTTVAFKFGLCNYDEYKNLFAKESVDVSYQSKNNSLSATNVQDALDEVAANHNKLNNEFTKSMLASISYNTEEVLIAIDFKTYKVINNAGYYFILLPNGTNKLIQLTEKVETDFYKYKDNIDYKNQMHILAWDVDRNSAYLVNEKKWNQFIADSKGKFYIIGFGNLTDNSQFFTSSSIKLDNVVIQANGYGLYDLSKNFHAVFYTSSLLSLNHKLTLHANNFYYFNDILLSNLEYNADGIWCYANTKGRCGFKLIEVKGNTIEEIKDFGIFDIKEGYNVIKIDTLLIRQNQQVCTYSDGQNDMGIAFTDTNVPSYISSFGYNTETNVLEKFSGTNVAFKFGLCNYDEYKNLFDKESSNVSYISRDNLLSATNVKDAIDEIAKSITSYKYPHLLARLTPYSDSKDYLLIGTMSKDEECFTNASFGVNDRLILNKSYAIDTRTMIVDFQPSLNSICCFGYASAISNNDFLYGGSVFGIDFKNFKLRIYAQTTKDLGEYKEFEIKSFEDYVNTKFRFTCRCIDTRNIKIKIEALSSDSPITLYDNVHLTTDATNPYWGLCWDRPMVFSLNNSIKVYCVKELCYLPSQERLHLYITGDSITEGDGTIGVDKIWSRMVAKQTKGVQAGRRAENIVAPSFDVDNICSRIKAEVEVLKPEIVMITHGANLGLTQENANKTIEYIQNLGCRVIFNHCWRWLPEFENKHNVYDEYETIYNNCAKKYNIDSVRFDIATSSDRNLNNEANSEYFHDNVHLNELGNMASYNQVKNDLPDIFEL